MPNCNTLNLKLIALSILFVAILTAQTTTSKENVSSLQFSQNMSSMPLAFTENQGQWDEKVQFRANAGGATMWFSPDGAFYQFTRTIESKPKSIVDKSYGMPDMMDRQPDAIETMMIKANFVG